MSVPKLTAVAPVKSVPVMVTDSVSPCSPLVGLTVVMVGAGYDCSNPPSLNMKSCAEFVVQLVPWFVEEAFIPPLYAPAVFTRQYTMLLVVPLVADSTKAYFVPATTG